MWNEKGFLFLEKHPPQLYYFKQGQGVLGRFACWLPVGLLVELLVELFIELLV